jgi:hypothetical protein
MENGMVSDHIIRWNRYAADVPACRGTGLQYRFGTIMQGLIRRFTTCSDNPLQARRRLR